MGDIDFAVEVEKILYKIAEIVEQSDPEGKIDVDLNDGILTLELDYGTFVINRQSAVKEIWLSSPISGPYHFAYSDGKWVARSGVELGDILSKELRMEIGNDW